MDPRPTTNFDYTLQQFYKTKYETFTLFFGDNILLDSSESRVNSLYLFRPSPILPDESVR